MSFATEYLLRVLTTHPIYRRVLKEYLQPEEAGVCQLANGKALNNNGNILNSNSSLHYNKKFEWGFYFIFLRSPLFTGCLVKFVLYLASQQDKKKKSNGQKRSVCVFKAILLYDIISEPKNDLTNEYNMWVCVSSCCSGTVADGVKWLEITKILESFEAKTCLIYRIPFFMCIECLFFFLF